MIVIIFVPTNNISLVVVCLLFVRSSEDVTSSACSSSVHSVMHFSISALIVQVSHTQKKTV